MSAASPSLSEIFETVARVAESHGLHFFGATRLDVKQDFVWYQKWLSEGRHAGMEYLQRHLDVRKNPTTLLDHAKTAWVFGLPYYTGDKWSRGKGTASPRIAMYARYRDYHKSLAQYLSKVWEDMGGTIADTTSHSHRITVDSVPLLERALAANTGGGFIGKNTCLIHPHKGSFFLLGEILTTWDPEIPHDEPVTTRHRERSPNGGCGTCKRCQVHCPTGALDEDYRIDARRCLSWWTIENRSAIPKEYWPWIGQYLFGCDICQLVCPWNRGIETQDAGKHRPILPETIDLYDVATMDQAMYERLFAGTPVTRAKREGLIRNALIAMHVRKHIRLEAALQCAAKETHEAITGTVQAIRSELVKS